MKKLHWPRKVEKTNIDDYRRVNCSQTTGQRLTPSVAILVRLALVQLRWRELKAAGGAPQRAGRVQQWIGGTDVGRWMEVCGINF